MRLSALLFVVILVMGGIGYWYYNDTQERMAVLTENNAKLETAIALSEEAISSLQEDYAAVQAESERINQAYADIRRQNDRLSSRIADIDLGILAAEKPAAMQRAVNRGTENAGRCFELLSGSILTDEERNASSGEDFNKECPWLWSGDASDGMSGNNDSAD
jgi:cell division protein FtsB